MANPHPQPFDAIARLKAREDLQRMTRLAALDDAYRLIEQQRSTMLSMMIESGRALARLEDAKAELLDAAFVPLPARRRNPDLAGWLGRLWPGRRPAPETYTAPAIDA